MLDISNFISPKQLLAMKKDIVEETLAMAYPIVAFPYSNGVMIFAENPSRTLFKTSEIYDRIAFAGTGVFNDYERLRKAGVQLADVKGFQYSRADVKARSIASEYSTLLGDIFARQQVPMEVEILLAEIGAGPEDNRMYYVPFSGGLIEEREICVIGDYTKEEGDIRKGAIAKQLRSLKLDPAISLEEGARVCRSSIARARGRELEELPAENVELVVLNRTTESDRKFRRYGKDEIVEILGR